jgi:hypothetical protein
MRCVFSTANPKFIYNIPNFCIVDPIYEKDFSSPKNEENNIEEKKINVFLKYIFNNEEHSFNVSNKIKGIELKDLYSKKANKPLTNYKIRLLFKGQEIKDDHSVFYHNIENDSQIQVSIAEL